MASVTKFMINREYAAKQLNKIQNRIQDAANAANRDASSIKLVGASKKQQPELIRLFLEQGLQALGENYLQEAIGKRAELDVLNPEWHFIGQIQSNKTKLVAQNFSWVHGVDRLKIAQRLAKQNPNSDPINILLQLNMDAEESKGGVLVDSAAELADQVAQIGGASLRGFMLIPQPRDSDSEQRAVFASAYQLMQDTNQRYGLVMDSLSMGMSGDLEAAIAEGSTIVRVGTDLFGKRE